MGNQHEAYKILNWCVVLKALIWMLLMVVWVSVYMYLMLVIIFPLMVLESILYGWLIKNPPIRRLWRWLEPHAFPPMW
jgi:hypothetical protein